MLVRVLAIVAGVVALATAGWYFWTREPPPPPPGAAAKQAAPPAAAGPQHPVERQSETPLPPLRQSDTAMLEALTGLLGPDALEKFFKPEEVVRRIVATVDNLPRESYATRLNPMKPIPGTFVASGSEETLAISPANAARYADFVKLVEGIDAGRAVALYLHFYPLFQEAYLELGYPEGYFNDRLVAVIDHLLATPEIRAPIHLATPHVLYEYANAELEERSSGQKAMLRMGPENAARLKSKLRELRAEIVRQSAKR